jgi:hypothetical protein
MFTVPSIAESLIEEFNALDIMAHFFHEQLEEQVMLGGSFTSNPELFYTSCHHHYLSVVVKWQNVYIIRASLSIWSRNQG